jgi:aminoacrylate hydrolase
MPKVSIGDAEIYYEATGDGPPLMLVPGLSGLGSFWAQQVPALSRFFRVIIHDHRGTGQSTRSMIRYSVDQMADDALRLMDALKIDKAHFAGHSTGGAISQTIATDRSDRMLSMVLSATWPGRDAYFNRCFDARKTVLAAAGIAGYLRLTNLFLYPPYWVTAHAADLDAAEKAAIPSQPPNEILVGRIDAIMAFDRRAKLPAVKKPTLVIVARDDVVTPPYQSEELAKLIPGAKLHYVERGGHFAPVIEPALYNPPVLEFLRKQAGV